MKTKEITVERNFHIMNDDRFIMEKISMTIELEEYNNPQEAIDIARDKIISNFKSAYPKVEESLNFHVVRQVNSSVHVTSEPKEGFVAWAIPTSKTPEKINKGTIEEQIDNSFNLIEEINKCKRLNLLGVYKVMCVTEEQEEAYKAKEEELIQSVKEDIKKREIASIMERAEALRAGPKKTKLKTT